MGETLQKLVKGQQLKPTSVAELVENGTFCTKDRTNAVDLKRKAFCF